MFDGEAFGAEIVSAVRSYVDGLVGPLMAENASLKARLETLEAERPAKGEKGEPGERGGDGEPGRDGVDGKDADPEVVRAMLEEIVIEHLTANPPPAGKDGRDGMDGKDGRDGIDGEKGDPGLNGKDGKDGIDGFHGKDGLDGLDGKDGAPSPVIAGAIKDHTGELVLTFTDGLVMRTGIFDGTPGEKGRDGLDGKDGLGFDDLDAQLADDGRTIVLRWARGEQVKEFRFALPVVLDRGVYKAGEAYQAGDGVTWAGSFWIAQEATAEKPDTGKGWRLAIKKGRDGKDGKDGVKGEKGDPGKNGRGF
jgi:hypothetical protein